MALEDAILDELKAQTKWLRLLGIQSLRQVLAQALKNEKQRAVYELSDGVRTSREVAQKAGVGAGTVATLWAEWISTGVCSESPKQAGRAAHLASLASLGIEVPNAKSLAGEVQA